MRDSQPVPLQSRSRRGLLMLMAALIVGAFSVLSAHARAQTEPGISVTPDVLLSQFGALDGFTVDGDLGAVGEDENTAGDGNTRAEPVLTVEVRGPADPASDPASLPVASSMDIPLETGDPAFPIEVSWADLPDLRVGGGYLVTVRTSALDGSELADSAWVGLVPPGTRIDLAAVWPIAYGIHRAPDGVFVDTVIQEAVRPSADVPGGLYALFRAAEQFPAWRMSLAVEPVLLDQMLDLADGYMARPEGEDEDAVEIDASDETAVQASRALEVLTAVSEQASVENLAMPYALPSFALLGSRGWEDGLDQMQVGKTLVQESLGLLDTIDGGYPPALDVTSDSLAYLAQSSIDYAVAATEVSDGLSEDIESASGPVRVRDRQDNRVTLLFAGPSVRASLSDPWDPEHFFAALAWEASRNPSGPVVSVPASDYGIPPYEFLERVGEGLERAPFVRTLTLGEAVADHQPSTRPVFLSRYGGYVEGFVGRAFQERLAETHAVVQDLRDATDSDRSPLDEVLLSVYRGESRYWFEGGADPDVVNAGIAHLDWARDRVLEEFDEIDVAGDKSVIMVGAAGEVPVAVVNQTGYPIEVEIAFEGRGLVVEGEERLSVTLGPQENIYQVPVDVGRGEAELGVRVSVGGTDVDEETIAVRSLGARSFVPWALGALAFVVVVPLIVWRLRA